MYKVIQAHEGGYIVIGGHEGSVIKTDPTGNVQWVKNYGFMKGWDEINVTDESCGLYDIKLTDDGGYILTGMTSNLGLKYNRLLPCCSTDSTAAYTRFAEDIYLVKINASGGLQWERTYGRPGEVNGSGSPLLPSDEFANSVEPTSDGGYIISGISYPELNAAGTDTQTNAFLLKVDDKGDWQWSKNYSTFSQFEQHGYFNSATPTNDGGFIATGNAYLGSAWVVKTNSVGVVQWQRVYNTEGVASTETGLNIYNTPDDGFILHSEGSGGSAGMYQFQQPISVYKLDANGNIKWHRTYGRDTEYSSSGGHYVSLFGAIIKTSTMTEDGGIAMSSSTDFSDQYGPQPGFTHFIKLDSSGKNGTCQNDRLGYYTSPTIFEQNYPLTVKTGNIELNPAQNSASGHPLVVDTNLCINAPIVASFTGWGGGTCLGDSSVFYNRSNGSLFYWDFGDEGSGTGNTSRLEDPKHLFSAAGTYTVTLRATDASGISTSTEKRSITIVPPEFITLGSDITLCIGDSVLLSATSLAGANGITWTPATKLRSTSGVSTYAFPTSTIKYKVTQSNGGCTDFDEIIVKVVPLTTLFVNARKTTCEGVPISVTVSGNAANYKWIPSESIAITTNTQVVAANPSITTTYTVTDANGCSDSLTIAIEVIPKPTLIVSPGLKVNLCQGDSIHLLCNGADTYTWNPYAGLNTSSGQEVITKPVIGLFTYTVTGTSTVTGCPAKMEITVNTTTLPTAVVSNNPYIVCLGNPVTLSASAVGGGEDTYTWSPALYLNSTTGESVIADPVDFGNYEYVVTLTDTNKCTDIETVRVSAVAEITANAGNDISVCSGSTSLIRATGGQNYFWQPATGLSTSIGNTTLFDISSPGNYTYTLTVTSGACVSSDELKIEVIPLPTLWVSPDTVVCSGREATLFASGCTSYLWEPSGETKSTLTISPLLTTSYTLTGTSNNCSDSISRTISIYPLPTISLSGLVSVCRGSAISLSASGGEQSIYLWNTGISSSSITVSPETDSIYSVSVTDTNNCMNTASQKISVISFPVTNAGTNKTICIGQTLTLNGSGGTAYFWSNGQTTSSISLSPEMTNKYALTTSTGPCSSTDTVTVFVNALPTITLTNDLTIIQSNSTTLSATGGSSYEWYPITELSCANCSSTTATPTLSTSYCVNVTDSNTCTNSKCVNVTIDIQCGELFIPNAFSPNDDKESDIMYLKTLNKYCISSLTIKIYDRWGNVIFRSFDTNIGWDGTRLGKEMDSGVYVFSLHADMIDGSQINKKGNIYLLR